MPLPYSITRTSGVPIIQEIEPMGSEPLCYRENRTAETNIATQPVGPWTSSHQTMNTNATRENTNIAYQPMNLGLQPQPMDMSQETDMTRTINRDPWLASGQNPFHPLAGHLGVNVPSKNKMLEPETFDGTSSTEWTEYIIHFEQIAEWNSWTDTQKAKMLSIKLREAQKLLGSLSSEQYNNYQTLKTALSHRFNP